MAEAKVVYGCCLINTQHCALYTGTISIKTTTDPFHYYKFQSTVDKQTGRFSPSGVCLRPLVQPAT